MSKQRVLPLDAEEREARVALFLRPGVGEKRFHFLLSHFGSAVRAVEAGFETRQTTFAPPSDAPDGARVDTPDPVTQRRLARRELNSTHRMGGRLLVYGDREYPTALAALRHPPPVLWVLGTLKDPPAAARAVAIVGQRKATGQGKQTATEIAIHLSRAGYTIVSGGAYGIDSAAHRGALEGGGHTVCVLGSALDRPYPTRHIPLFRNILQSGGAVLSPFPLQTDPHRGCFLCRNRVVAGLAQAVIVVEAGHRSGAHNTVFHARRMQKTVLACPGSPGTQFLLNGGAGEIQDGETAARALAGAVSPQRSGTPCAPWQGLDDDAQKLVRRLVAKPELTAAQLAEWCAQPLANTVALLMELEIDGRVVSTPGGRYRVP
jgi:DNA processing protein